VSDKAFIDVSCPKCRRKFGWFGTMTERPPCPRCGHEIDKASLAHDQAKIDEFRTLLAERREANPNWDQWRKARVAAGLTLRQAAKILEVAPVMLAAIERGENKPSQALADRMARCYGG
jgi:ribosome-binding protein aMBF1 (putative translation factor)